MFSYHFILLKHSLTSSSPANVLGKMKFYLIFTDVETGVGRVPVLPQGKQVRSDGVGRTPTGSAQFCATAQLVPTNSEG